MSQRVRSVIRNVPDFPKPGILFRDITTLLLRPDLMQESLEEMWRPFDGQVDIIAGIESRGFLLGAALSVTKGLPFVPLRKPGKLPAETIRESYTLEYGTDALEMHRDAVSAGSRVLIVDDLLATGGTAAAAARLVEHVGGRVVGLSFLIELVGLGGRDRLGDASVHVLLAYDEA
ncbi:MAG: adenine phosphoribosyltransferase [Candidatus Eisenbacteria bacterium]|uniref:Adenine phosphoribosyltransferase n=1 Tax=Eiseniibacteriota bacterium TaxID=2212470 RepID=A0A956M1Z5_UNCEI|nr:adenine phosphoribosyltransferase [Candidatus Eisenbacteria bacterium]